MRSAKVFIHDRIAGRLRETENGYEFTYSPEFLHAPHAEPISLTLPLTDTPHTSTVMFPFFDGLIPEGWLLDIAERNWKLNARDRMGLVISCCKECIGAVSVVAEPTS